MRNIRSIGTKILRFIVNLTPLLLLADAFITFEAIKLSGIVELNPRWNVLIEIAVATLIFEYIMIIKNWQYKYPLVGISLVAMAAVVNNLYILSAYI